MPSLFSYTAGLSAETDSPAPPPGDCPFCALQPEVTAFRFDDRFLALYNIAPVLPGHALVIPRRHVVSVLALSADELAGFFVFAREITRFLGRAFAADGFDWTVQDGPSAGQTVLHLHLHIIPRHIGDLPEPGDWYPALMASEAAQIDSRTRPRLTPAEHAQVTAHLRKLADEQAA
jgi:bis(5'-adenosyl)-triphosphatase